MKIDKPSVSGARKKETKPKSLESKKRKVTLEMDQEAFKGLSPIEIKQKVIILIQSVTLYFTPFRLNL